MLGTDRLRVLMADYESDRVEPTVSTKNTDTSGEAICAFANDFPNHRQPGYLLVGVDDDGKAAGLTATDELLRRGIASAPTSATGNRWRGRLAIPLRGIAGAVFGPKVFGPKNGVANSTGCRMLQVSTAR